MGKEQQMLKLTTLIFSTIFASAAFASTHGGGVLMNNFSVRPSYDLLGGTGGGGVMKTPEIVFHMGQKDGLVKFAYGHLEGNQWQIQKVQIPVTDLTLAPEEISALEKSEITKDWAYIK